MERYKRRRRDQKVGELGYPLRYLSTDQGAIRGGGNNAGKARCEIGPSGHGGRRGDEQIRGMSKKESEVSFTTCVAPTKNSSMVSGVTLTQYTPELKVKTSR